MKFIIWRPLSLTVCPMELVRCDREALANLLNDLDKIAWEDNEGEGKGIYYEVKKEGEIVEGGMGGGLVTNNLWVHDEFKDIVEDIKQVIEGKKKTI